MRIKKVLLAHDRSQADAWAVAFGLTAIQRRERFYIANTGLAIVWAFGPLFVLKDSVEYLDLGPLPFLPGALRYKLKDSKSASQYRAIKGLLSTADEVVLGVDASPESEAIVRNIVEFSGYSGLVTRALYFSTDIPSMVSAFTDRHALTVTDPLFTEYKARYHSDWLLSANVRGLLAMKGYSIDDVREKTVLNRLFLAACSLVVSHDKSRSVSKPVVGFDISLCFSVDGMAYMARLDLESLPPSMLRKLTGKKITDRADADRIKEYLDENITKAKISYVHETSATIPPPPLFNATSLQLHMWHEHGVDVDLTYLSLLKLYNAPFSAISYPLTDAVSIPSMLDSRVRDIFDAQIDSNSELSTFCYFSSSAAVFKPDSAHSHTGILPTIVPYNQSLGTPTLRKIYDVICRRFMCQFADPATINHQEVEIEVGNLVFRASSSQVASSGFMSIQPVKLEISTPIPITSGESIGLNASVKIDEKLLPLPSPLTKADLLDALTNVKINLTDKNNNDVLSANDSIGSVENRTDAIIRLCKSKLVTRRGHFIEASHELFALVDALPTELKCLTTASLWERGYQSIKEKRITDSDFIGMVESQIAKMVSNYMNPQTTVNPKE